MVPPRRGATRRPVVAGPARWLVLVLVLVTVLVPGAAERDRCRAGDSLVSGDLVINGLFPYLGGDDCTSVGPFARQLEVAAEWAVRRVNARGVLQAGVLGLRSYPICTTSSSLATVITTQAYTDGADPACVEGAFAGFLSPTLPVAAEALLAELPVTRAVVPAAGGAALAETLADLAAALGWTAVTVVTDDRGGRAAGLVERLEYLGLCVTRWVTVTGRQLEAFSELSSLADGSCLVGSFELSQLQLRQLGRLRCVLGLQRPGQLRHVPEGALVAFDAAAEVAELTEALRGSAADTGAWEAVVSDGWVTAPAGVGWRGEVTTEESAMSVAEPVERLWPVMDKLSRHVREWTTEPGEGTTDGLEAKEYSSEEAAEMYGDSRSSVQEEELESTESVPSVSSEEEVLDTETMTTLPRETSTKYVPANTTAEVHETSADAGIEMDSFEATESAPTSMKPPSIETHGAGTDGDEASSTTNPLKTTQTNESSTITAESYTTTTRPTTLDSVSNSESSPSETADRTTISHPVPSARTQDPPSPTDTTTASLGAQSTAPLSSSTLPVTGELTAPPTALPPPFVPNPAAVHAVRLVYNYARTVQLQLMRLCPEAGCDAAAALRRAADTYSDLGQEFVAGLDLTLVPENITVYLAGGGGARPVGWRSGGHLHLSAEAALPPPAGPAAPEPCPALFTQPVRWRVGVWTTVLATLAAVGALACLCFLCFYWAASCRRLEHGQGWMALLVAATLLQYAATVPFFLRRGRLVCALRLQAPALGLAAPLSVLLSRALCLAAAHTTRGDFGHVSGMLQSTLCFFIFLVQVGMSTERLLTLQWSAASDTGGPQPQPARCHHSPQQQLAALGYVLLLQVLQFVLNPWVALCGRNYCEGPLTAVYTCLAVLLWSGALTLYYLGVPLLDSDSAAPQLCLGLVVLASLSLVVVHVPRVLLITREVSGLGALPHLRRYRDRSASALGESTAHLQRYQPRSASALAQAAAIRQPRHRRDTVELNEAISLHHMDGPATRTEGGAHQRSLSADVTDTTGGGRANHEFQPPPPGGQRNRAFQSDDSVSIGEAETASVHSENKYPSTTEM
ncbi:uncharacterized protein LOC122382941 [Amphibalanus amphitrite]|uniref:uncharacterized protein LOC122382941 n=1 Tax=Amphibalanus amphitrite TaxID=1232801 RepID=UPI001C91E188|nr:uncharacterized protein LOC122382941 [Amphibalanus amphitrite]